MSIQTDRGNDTLLRQQEEKDITFRSSDKELERTFYWAKKMALSYAHDKGDPVGPWYEAALPGREAFCMRDMAHQSVAAEILGLSKHNENMLTKFVENIAESRDWCSYWEINKWDKPAPVDYKDDQHFWYNLNANFDIIYACLKVYEWTGNERLLKDPRFTKFYNISLNEYVDRWQLTPEEIMERPQFLNVDDPDNNSHRAARGLPSYVENYPGLTASSDLIASIYAGFNAYSKIAEINKNVVDQMKYAQQAQQYQNLLENKWWDSRLDTYHTFWTSKSQFANGEGLTYILWFDASSQVARRQATLEKIMNRKNWNVENQSHFPTLFYELNHVQDAYRQLIALRTVKRNEYPEVSFGAIEGIIGGTMGIRPIFQENRIVTLPRLTRDRANDWLEVENLPVFGGHVTVKHHNNYSSRLTNLTDQDLMWTASFMGEHKLCKVDGTELKTEVSTDKIGNKISFVTVAISKGKTLSIEVSR